MATISRYVDYGYAWKLLTGMSILDEFFQVCIDRPKRDIFGVFREQPLEPLAILFHRILQWGCGRHSAAVVSFWFLIEDATRI